MLHPSADTMPDLSGKIINARYELLSLLGCGTYGAVYKAIDRHNSAPSEPHYCAVKVSRNIGHPEKIGREVYMHTLVSKHPNVINIHGAYADMDYDYIFLEYIESGSLFEKAIAAIYCWNDELLRTAFLSIIDAVQVCHDVGMAHRDIKLENILASEDGSKLYLADFGEATKKRMTKDFCVGSLRYMAPEVVAMFGEQPFCPRAADVWALGVLLFTMMTGCGLWQKPSFKDRLFERFMMKGMGYLYEQCAMSRGAQRIIGRIFTINPSKRITLSELRAEIVALDTFFRDVPEEEEVQENTQSSPVPSLSSRASTLESLVVVTPAVTAARKPSRAKQTPTQEWIASHHVQRRRFSL